MPRSRRSRNPTTAQRARKTCNAHESDSGHSGCWIVAGAGRRAHAESAAPRQTRRHCVPLTHRDAGGDLHGPIDARHGTPAERPRRRRQRLVFPRSVGGLALAPVEPADRRREDLGRGQDARPRLHLRQDVLVVQHVLERRLERDAAADVSGRRAQDSGPLRASRRTARRTRCQARPVPAVQVLGPAGRHHVERVDRQGDAARHGDAQPDPDARPTCRTSTTTCSVSGPNLGASTDPAGSAAKSTRSAAT